MKRKIITMILIFTFLGGTILAQETEWKLEKEKDGISVFTREVGGMKIKEFKATTVIRSDIEYLVSMMLDVENFDDWMDNIKSAEVVKEISEDELYVYTVVNLPWPFDDRDIVALNIVNREIDSGFVTISITGVEDIVPEKKGIVRMPESAGFWKFTQKNDEEVAVVYQYLADPGGGVPDWLVNMFIVDTPFKTLENMRNIAEAND